MQAFVVGEQRPVYPKNTSRALMMSKGAYSCFACKFDRYTPATLLLLLLIALMTFMN